MRYLAGLVCVLALGVMPLVGCGDNEGAGGTGGHAGTGGTGNTAGNGGTAGTGGTDMCTGITCEDTECKTGGVCDPSEGICDFTFADDGTPCSEGECLNGVCAPVGAFPCTEQGIRDAIAAGGGPHYFACDGPTTVVTDAEIAIDNDVILDGEGNLRVDGNDHHRVFSVSDGITVELRSFTITGGRADELTLSETAKGGGAILNEGTVALLQSTLSDNVTKGRNGGAISNLGIMSIDSSEVSRNAAAREYLFGWRGGFGGGVSNVGSLSIRDSHISQNVAEVDGGGLFNQGELSVTDTEIAENSEMSGSCGAGLSNRSIATLVRTTVSSNHGQCGGGIVNGYNADEESGSLTILNSSLSDNAGHGIGNFRGVVILRGSTVSGSLGFGGIVNFAQLELENSTVSGNVSQDDSFFGGISNRTLTQYQVPPASLTLVHSTVVDNIGGGIGNKGAVLAARNSIVGDGCYGDTIPTFTSWGHNIEFTGDTCSFDQETDQVGVSAVELKLGELANNGGPTDTHSLGAGSVAIDAIPEEDCVGVDGGPLTTDQRGVSRPQGPACDVGAVEMEVTP